MKCKDIPSKYTRSGIKRDAINLRVHIFFNLTLVHQAGKLSLPHFPREPELIATKVRSTISPLESTLELINNGPPSSPSHGPYKKNHIHHHINPRKDN